MHRTLIDRSPPRGGFVQCSAPPRAPRGVSGYTIYGLTALRRRGALHRSHKYKSLLSHTQSQHMNITINNNKDAVDRTNYGLTRQCTRLFEMHHKQRISLAAVMTDAKAIRRRLRL